MHASLLTSSTTAPGLHSRSGIPVIRRAKVPPSICLAMICCLAASAVGQQIQSISLTTGSEYGIPAAGDRPSAIDEDLAPTELEFAWLEYELAIAEYELALRDYEQALRDYELAVAEYELAQVEDALDSPEDPKKTTTEAEDMINRMRANLAAQQKIKAEKEKAFLDALNKVMAAAAKDPKAVAKGGILAVGVKQGDKTVVRVKVDKFDPNTEVTVTINTPGQPTTAKIPLGKDGAGSVDINVPTVAPLRPYVIDVSGTKNGKLTPSNGLPVPIIEVP